MTLSGESDSARVFVVRHAPLHSAPASQRQAIGVRVVPAVDGPDAFLEVRFALGGFYARAYAPLREVRQALALAEGDTRR